MKKIIFSMVSFCAAVAIAICPLSASALYDPGFDPSAQGVYMVNTDTNSVIYEKNADTQIVPASMVKMMTAILALESMPADQVDTLLQTQVTAPSYVFDELYGLDASTADIRSGETLTMQDLLYALMLSSACEAAGIIADYVSGGDIDAFVDKMNEKAKEIGANNTVFVDPHGLDEETQRSTAYDMYLIADYAMQNETFAKIAATQSYTMAATNKHAETRNITHTNYMMSPYLGGSYYDSRVKGIKTGTATGIRNLVSAAESDSYHYLLVVMGSSTASNKNMVFEDTENLYDWAFDELAFETVGQPYEKMIPNNVKVNLGKNTDALVLTPQDQVIQLLPSDIDPASIAWDTSKLPAEMNAPLSKGDYVGDVDLRLSDQVIQTIPVVVGQDVSASIPSLIWYYITMVVTSWWFLTILGIIILLGVLYFVMVVRHNKKRKHAANKDRYFRNKR